jgi:uncharacterized protein YlxW (UPF0749 family)
LGQKWSDEEEALLLNAISVNQHIDLIAQNHNRTKGGIYCRLQHIAYKMYVKNISIEEIIEKTKLDEICIKKIIDKKENYSSIQESKKSIESEIFELKNEVKQLRNTIKELVEMMKAVYEFEEVR